MGCSPRSSKESDRLTLTPSRLFAPHVLDHQLLGDRDEVSDV